MPADAESVTLAAKALRAGEIVAFATETVYGLGADASNDEAVAEVFKVKGRPGDHPLIVHLLTVDEIDEWAVEISEEARDLAYAFWPGPLTIVFKRSSKASDSVTGGLETVALRVPSHPVARAPQGEEIPFEVNAFRKYCLINGLDDIGLTLRHKDKIEAFEKERLATKPWLAHTM